MQAVASGGGTRRQAKRRLWLRWTLATASGELVGFAIPAAAGALCLALGAGDVLLALAVTLAALAKAQCSRSRNGPFCGTASPASRAGIGSWRPEPRPCWPTPWPCP